MSSDLFEMDVDNVTNLASEERRHLLRMIEAILFASSSPVSRSELAERLPAGADVDNLVSELQSAYASRGVNVRAVDGAWAMRTAEDLSHLLNRDVEEQKRLSRAALETLAIIAYHQPVTRAEIEEIRGVATSRGTLDVLLAAEWIRLRGRRKTPGRPVTFGTTPAFLDHFGLESIRDLPGLADLKSAGLLDSAIPPGLQSPDPDDRADLADDEDPLEDEAGTLDADTADANSKA